MKKNCSLLILIIAAAMNSCDYLDTIPGDAIDNNTFWSTANAAALEQYCNLYYPKLIKGHGDPQSWTIGDMINSEYQSDNLLGSAPSIITFGQNTVLTSNSDWSWSVVRGCNEFLTNYEKSPASISDKRRYAGEMLFSRHSTISIK